MKIKKNILLVLLFSLLFSLQSLIFSFEWPEKETTTESYGLYFSQNRGSLLSISQIFSQPSEVLASENGKLLTIITELEDDNDFFPSTLGTAVILGHEDELLTVYANLDTASLSLELEKSEIKEGDFLGESGSTGWQEGKSNLEFQIIDKKNNTAINPKLLMPRLEKDLPLSLTGIVIQNKNGEQYEISSHKTFGAGMYKIYCKKNEIVFPFKTSVSVNGILLDQISYDTIIQENSKLYVIGKKKYSSEDIFPSENLQLLGEAMLTSGRATLTLTMEDNLGNQKQVNYNISVY